MMDDKLNDEKLQSEIEELRRIQKWKRNLKLL